MATHLHLRPLTLRGLQSRQCLRQHVSAAARKVGKNGKNGNAANLNSGHFGNCGDDASAKYGKNGNASRLPTADLVHLEPPFIRPVAVPPPVANITPVNAISGKNGLAAEVA